MIYTSWKYPKYAYLLFVVASLQGCGAGTGDSEIDSQLDIANENGYTTVNSADSETQLIATGALSGLVGAQTTLSAAAMPETAAATTNIALPPAPEAATPVAVETTAAQPVVAELAAALPVDVEQEATTALEAAPPVPVEPIATTPVAVEPTVATSIVATPVAANPVVAELATTAVAVTEPTEAVPVPATLVESELVDAAIAEAPKPPSESIVAVETAITTETIAPVAEPEVEFASAEPIVEVDFQNDYPSSIQCYEFPEDDMAFGQVDNDDWRAWVDPTPHRYSGSTEFISIEQTAEGKPTLRQKLEPSSKGSQTVSAAANLTSESTYRLTQAVYLEPGFDWGGTNEGGKLGFGLGGGSAPTGGLLQTDGFTVRFMWHGNKDGTAYVTIYSYAADRKQSLPYGDDYPLEGFDVPIGEWFDLAMEVTVNSATDKSDGTLKAWANGELLVELEDIQWQSSGDEPAVQRLIYTTFYGGNDSSWSPDQTTYIKFADVCWSPVIDEFEPIDPALSSARNAEQFQSTKDSEGTIYSDYTESEPKSVEFAQFADSPRASIINAITDIELTLPAQNDLIDWYFYNALDRLNESLDAADWIDNYSVNETSGTMTHIYEAVRDAQAASIVADAPEFVQSQVDTISTSLALAAADLAEDQLAIATKAIAQCTANCQHANTKLAQAQNELVSALGAISTSPLTSIGFAEQARKSALAAIVITSSTSD